MQLNELFPEEELQRVMDIQPDMGMLITLNTKENRVCLSASDGINTPLEGALYLMTSAVHLIMQVTHAPHGDEEESQR